MENTEVLASDQPCFFLSLPREIRDEIYNYLVPQPPDNHRRLWLNLPSEGESVSETEAIEMPGPSTQKTAATSSSETRDEDSDCESVWTYESSVCDSFTSYFKADSDDDTREHRFTFADPHELQENETCALQCMVDIILVNHQIRDEFMDTLSRMRNISLYVRMENTADDPYSFTFNQKFWTLPYLRCVRRLFVIAEWHSNFGPNARDNVYGEEEDPTYDHEYPDDRREGSANWPDFVAPYFIYNNGDDMRLNASHPRLLPPLLRKMPVRYLPQDPWSAWRVHLGDDREPEYSQNDLNASCLDASAVHIMLATAVDSLLEKATNVVGLDVSIKLTGYAYGPWTSPAGEQAPDGEVVRSFFEEPFLCFRPTSPRVKYLAKTLIHGEEIIRRKEETYIEHRGAWEDYLGGFAELRELQDSTMKWPGDREESYIMYRDGPDPEWTTWVVESDPLKDSDLPRSLRG